MKKTIYLFLSAILISSCSGHTDEAQIKSANEEEDINNARPQCSFSLDPATFKVEWVAYKYSDKKGVPGKFEDFIISGYNTGENISDILSSAEFSINTNSLNTGDNTRDPKILKFFFNKMNDGSNLNGKVTSVSGDMTGGTIEFMLNMNGYEHSVNGTYRIERDMLDISAKINLDLWMAQDALKSLNTECRDLHKGTDGVNKLWPDVSLFASASIIKTCD